MSKWILDETDIVNTFSERIKCLEHDRSHHKSLGFHSMASEDSAQLYECSTLFQKIRNKANIVADAVEVVRCKDCKHYDGGVCMKYLGIYDAVFDVDYCSRGERREDNAQRKKI